MTANLELSNAAAYYPQVSRDQLLGQFVGKNISEVPAPAVIIDAAVVRRNCKIMLDSARQLNVGFRAHVKTHKTVELARLQVGEDSTQPVKLIASTVAEIEHLLPWLQECQRAGRIVDVLYGFPIAPSRVSRIATIAKNLGAGCIGLFVDNAAQIEFLEAVPESKWPGSIPVWVQIDVGYHREGVAPESSELAEIAKALATAKRVQLGGLYAHNSLSYSVGSPDEALQWMAGQLEGLHSGALAFLQHSAQAGSDTTSTDRPSAPRVVLSLGDTPTAASIQNLVNPSPSAKRYLSIINDIQADFDVEFHAGVYPVLDMQQIATQARASTTSADIGIRTLVEVASVYPSRGEALIAAGSIVLGREPCKSYSGWGVVTPWPARSVDGCYDPSNEQSSGWIVGRISQEHGILTWSGPKVESGQDIRHLRIGEKLLVWPNHACIAGVNFAWYLIVDSDQADPDNVVDVWVRCRGW